MLTIRLSRIGKKNKPMYRIIISEKARDPYGRALEILGSYNPYTKKLEAKGDRINYWLSQGSGISPTVNNLLLEKGLIKGEKVKASSPGKKKKEEEDEKGKEVKDEKKEEVKEEITTEDKKVEEKDKKEDKKETPNENVEKAEKKDDDKKEEKPEDKDKK